MKQKFENLGILLSRDAQKKIGGGGGTTCFAQVNGQINAYQADNFSTAYNNAKNSATGHWCCSSCSTATWLQGVVEFRHE